jgi:AraC-like DNA-binding protein
MDESAGEPDEISRSEPRTEPQDGMPPAEKATGPLEIVAHIARRTFTALERKPGVSPSQVTVWTVKYISNHFSETISLAALASGAQLSKYHFLRKFRQEAGMTPGAYLKRYRIVQAMDYLTGTRHTVKKIGRMVGYRDPAAFSRAFTQLAGTQPYLYRVTRQLKAAEQQPPAQLPRADFIRQEAPAARQDQPRMGT